MQKLSANTLHTEDDPPVCCFINDVCGYSLKGGIVIVGATAIIVSILALISSVVYLLSISEIELMCNSNPRNAINLLTALVCISTSLYQIVISILMLWFLRWKKTVLLLKLWDVSNLGLLTLFSFLILARAAVFILAKEYLSAIYNSILGVIYEAVFIYFCIIVRNYEGSLDPDTFCY